MKTKLSFFVYLLSAFTIQAQMVPADTLYSAAHLKEDLAFLKQQVYHVHANPYTEFSVRQYDQLFRRIDAALTGPLSATDFLRLVKPVIAHLSDEHANIGLPEAQWPSRFTKKAIYLPFALQPQGGEYVIGDVLVNHPALVTGTVVRTINKVPVATWLQQCTDYSSGYPDRREEAVLRLFGYYFGWANNGRDTLFSIGTGARGTLAVTGIRLESWNDYLDSQSAVPACEERITYRVNGSTGYINACSFDVKTTGTYTIAYFRNRIDSIFRQIQTAGIQRLVIDVSKNEGGNSAVGDYLIAHITRKPYRTYQSTWKRSLEYQKLYESWGFKNEQYAGTPVGNVLHFPSGTTTPPEVPYPFTGKAVVMIGASTFSSAVQFATVIKDNRIVPVVGQTPANGHPNHFGEMYNTTLPHTKITLRFGVKEWIRPAGKQKASDNLLTPDVVLTKEEMQDIPYVIDKVNHQ